MEGVAQRNSPMIGRCSPQIRQEPNLCWSDSKDCSSNPFKCGLRLKQQRGGADCAPTPAPFIYRTLRTPYFTHLTTKQALATAL